MEDINIGLFILWIGVLFVLIILSAFFSGIETAITAVSKLKIKNLSDKGNKRALLLDVLLKTPGKVITTILIGNNLVNIAASSLATAIAITYLHKLTSNIAVITTVVTVVMTIIILIFGEILPKNFAMVRAERVSLSVSPILRVFTSLMSPISSVLSYFSRIMIKMLTGRFPEKGSIITEDELKYMLKISEEEGILEEEEKEMIQGIIDLGESVVREIMTPRTDMACIELQSTIDDVIDIVTTTGHSRIPVFDERIDNVKGIIYAKDLLGLDISDRSKGIESLIKDAFYVPETKKIDELLKEMKSTKNHISIVIDEYGGTSGVVSIEDILEEIVGEIQDEFDEEEPPHMIEIEDDLYEFSARISIGELNEILLSTIPEEEDFDTLGGFMCSVFGKIPEQGESIEWKNLKFTIDEMDDQRIMQVKVKINRNYVSTESEESDSEKNIGQEQ